jgi:hypothetical protein
VLSKSRSMIDSFRTRGFRAGIRRGQARERSYFSAGAMLVDGAAGEDRAYLAG